MWEYERHVSCAVDLTRVKPLVPGTASLTRPKNDSEFDDVSKLKNDERSRSRHATIASVSGDCSATSGLSLCRLTMIVHRAVANSERQNLHFSTNKTGSFGGLRHARSVCVSTETPVPAFWSGSEWSDDHPGAGRQ